MKTIRVVAAVIRSEDKIFATHRGYGDFKGGWEFPGGKIEAEEPTDDVEYELIKRQFDEMCRYLGWNIDFFKKFYAVEKNAIAHNTEALAEVKAVGEKYAV